MESLKPMRNKLSGMDLAVDQTVPSQAALGCICNEIRKAINKAFGKQNDEEVLRTIQQVMADVETLLLLDFSAVPGWIVSLFGALLKTFTSCHAAPGYRFIDTTVHCSL